jgi:hypothetical protein
VRRFICIPWYQRELKDFEEAGKGFGETYKFRYYPARIDYIFADEKNEKFENFHNS